MTARPAPEWAVTVRTGPARWSTVTVPAADHEAAIRHARRLLGVPATAPATAV